MFAKAFAKAASIALAAGLAAGIVVAQDRGGPYDAAITARQSHMRLYAHNLGILGAMAKGVLPYDADLARSAASNLAALASLDQRTYWPQGSDSFSFDYTRALPKLWDNIPDAIRKGQDLAAATAAFAKTAGDGLEAVQAGLGKVGGACKACHKEYRKPQN